MSVLAEIGQNAVFVLLLPFLAVAAATDLTRRHVSNLLIVYMLGCGVAAQAAFFGSSGLLSALGGSAVGLGLLLPFYALGGMGAGDVKLLAAAGSFLGPYDALFAGLFTLAAGGVLALAVLAWRGLARLMRMRAPTGPFAAALGVPSLELPYSLAIASGTLIAAYKAGAAPFAAWTLSW